MRIFALFFCFLFVDINQSFSQYHIEPLLQNEQYQLNGGLRASLGGRSRVIVPVNIPRDCIELIYTLVSSSTSDAMQNINLATKLAAIYGSGGGTIASGASQLNLPRGTETADAHLMSSRLYCNSFEAKDDGNRRCFQDYSGQACRSCAVFIPIDTANTPAILYLGLKNPSALDGISVQLNVVAIFDNTGKPKLSKNQNIN